MQSVADSRIRHSRGSEVAKKQQATRQRAQTRRRYGRVDKAGLGRGDVRQLKLKDRDVRSGPD